jgi:hypothetical protein
VGGAGSKGRKSVALTTSELKDQEPAALTTHLPSSPIKLPSSAFSQYGSNLTEAGDIFPMMAKIMNKAVEQPQP